MSKVWFYEVMGSPVGPISSPELKSCVQQRRILPETRIRLGTDGKWQTADRVKGLFDAPASSAPKPVASPPKANVHVERSVSISETPTAEIASLKTPTSVSIPVTSAEVTDDSSEITYHFEGEDHAPAKLADQPAVEEYDFFKFVGFENAIGTPLFRVLSDHCGRQRLTIAQATRRALAGYLGRKDLGGEPAAAPAPAPQPEPIDIS